MGVSRGVSYGVSCGVGKLEVPAPPNNRFTMDLCSGVALEMKSQNWSGLIEAGVGAKEKSGGVGGVLSSAMT